MFQPSNVVPSVVFDFGTHTTKAGFGGECLPRFLCCSSVGLQETSIQNESVTRKASDFIVGERNLLKRIESTEIVSPFDESGVMENWEAIEAIISYSSNQISADLSTNSVMIVEPSQNPKKEREKLVELLFEKFDVPSVYLLRSAIATCFANGRYTGCAVELGAKATDITPVFEGAIIGKKSSRLSVGGDHLTGYVLRQVAEKGLELNPFFTFRRRFHEEESVKETAPKKVFERVEFSDIRESYLWFWKRRLAEDIKVALCRVNDQPDIDLNSIQIPFISYELPDGTVVEMGKEKYDAADCLIDPSKVELPSKSLVGEIINVIESCDSNLHRELYSSICLSGGTSNLTGLLEYLTVALSRRMHKVKLLGSSLEAERRFAAWTGGSMLATFGEFQKMWLSKAEYEENGKTFIHKKCP
ncbi:Actin-related protein 4 [Galdieria sulphuraria]|uniref:Actin n=1 Tax=Galdieria sulphuraria TaxID=130081 RepID=M2Y8T7_GALSU|nr:actin [Galdieria sulphuraria]EME32254.1 actin [Galdieria sulphuraria]GJD09682.1 Actin-related protein 4 [Galdieria sulphuraria]|eukprot:XP_005708774.1 actin [Galdieria sulphuraria]